MSAEGTLAPDQARSSRGTPDRRRVKGSLADRDGFLAWAMLSPAVVYILAVVAVPFGLSVAFAFSDVTAGDPSFDWVGLRNFERAFDDPVFWKSLGNTFLFTSVSMLLIIVFGKILANILVTDFRGKWLIRFLVLLPWTTPVALSSVAWLWLYDSVYSPFDWVLRNLGLIESHMYFLGKPGLATASVILVHVWRIVPLAAVIMMVGLLGIPQDVKDAAKVDGAGFWRRMFEVTVPLTAPLIAVAALFGAIFTFTDMAVVYILTRGGPTNSTQVLSSWAFIVGIEGGDIGQGAAIALFLFPLLLAAAILILRAVRKIEVF